MDDLSTEVRTETLSPLPMERRQKLIKLMQLAQSDNDKEALTALRAANKILHTHNMDWDRMFNAIDERKIIAWENDQGGTTFRPHAWAFDMDSEEPKKLKINRAEPKVIDERTKPTES